MSRFAVFVLCIQVCLLQTAFSQQCGCNQISYGPSGLCELDYNKYAVSAPSSSSVSQPSISVSRPSYNAQYGGTGTGQVGVSGDIGASGQTVVVGSVPVLGSVQFGGKVSAAGSVSISGRCGCGCS